MEGDGRGWRGDSFPSVCLSWESSLQWRDKSLAGGVTSCLLASRDVLPQASPAPPHLTWSNCNQQISIIAQSYTPIIPPLTSSSSRHNIITCSTLTHIKLDVSGFSFLLPEPPADLDTDTDTVMISWENFNYIIKFYVGNMFLIKTYLILVATWLGLKET